LTESAERLKSHSWANQSISLRSWIPRLSRPPDTCWRASLEAEPSPRSRGRSYEALRSYLPIDRRRDPASSTRVPHRSRDPQRRIVHDRGLAEHASRLKVGTGIGNGHAGKRREVRLSLARLTPRKPNQRAPGVIDGDNIMRLSYAIRIGLLTGTCCGRIGAAALLVASVAGSVAPPPHFTASLAETWH
jgi:hypothetical protein